MPGKQAIERIPLVAPVPSLLTSVRPLPNVDWRSGIAWTPVSCDIASHNWNLCKDPVLTMVGEGEEAHVVSSPAEKTIEDGLADAVGTDPFLIYTGVECEDVLTEGGDVLTSVVREIDETHTAFQMARALWMGDGYTTTADVLYGLPPTLRRSATDISPNGAALLLEDVFAELLVRYELCTHGNGGAVLHVPTVLMPSVLGASDGGVLARPEGSLYRGPLGSVVSPGPGYPHGASAEGANGYGPLVSSPPEVYQGNGYNEAWIYITGPIEYALSDTEVIGTDSERRAPLRTNMFTALAERRCILRFDPCCVFAMRTFNAAHEVS